MKLTILVLLSLASVMVLGCSSTKEHTDESVATPTPTPEPPKPPTEITIHDAAAQQEFVTIRATGQDLDFVNLTVTAKEHGFDFTIPAGTLLINGSRDNQNMMVARTVVLSFTDPSQPLQQETKLEVYCVNLFKHVPTSSNTFSVGSYQPQSELVKLVQCLENSSEEKDIRQQSVWIMSDNPTWEQYIKRDRIDMIFSRDTFRELLKQSSGQEPTDEQLDAVIAEYRQMPDDELRELVKPYVTPQIARSRKLFEECNVPTDDRNLFQNLPE